jgi:hypothetical protein
MNASQETRYIVFDTESVVDAELLARVHFAGEGLASEAAVERYRTEKGDPDAFVPVSYHVPVAVAVARVGADFRLQKVDALDAPRFRSRQIVEGFWKGVQHYQDSYLVDFNGRGFDIPLLTLAAFRYGVSCPRYFADHDRYGFRYRFTDKHIDLLEWLTEYGAFRLAGGLDLLAKLLGKPGKMETSGSKVAELYAAGRVAEINDYCVHDVLDTYFVFLRTRVLTGELSLAAEQRLVEEMRRWLQARSGETSALVSYLANFGEWSG